MSSLASPREEFEFYLQCSERKEGLQQLHESLLSGRETNLLQVQRTILSAFPQMILFCLSNIPVVVIFTGKEFDDHGEERVCRQIKPVLKEKPCRVKRSPVLSCLSPAPHPLHSCEPILSFWCLR